MFVRDKINGEGDSAGRGCGGAQGGGDATQAAVQLPRAVHGYAHRGKVSGGRVWDGGGDNGDYVGSGG